MTGNLTDNILDMEVRVQLQRAQQGYGVQVAAVNPNSTLSVLGVLTGQGDMNYIGEWLKQGLTLQITRITVSGVPIPPILDEYGIPSSIDGGYAPSSSTDGVGIIPGPINGSY